MSKLRRGCIEVTQPIGTFYLTSLAASDLISQVRISPRTTSSDDNEDVQRSLNLGRVKEIAHYANDPDATFPTPIILSVNSGHVRLDESTIEFFPQTDIDGKATIGELLDGQHRVRGLQRAAEEGTDLSSFDLPLVVMLDLDAAEKAYVFSIINSKQTPVSKSLIYDLFGLTQQRSPYRTCHEIARAMNLDEGGPFFRGLKMLGKRESPTEMLTQGSFVKYLLRLISSKPDRDLIALKRGEDVPPDDSLPFNAFWRNGKDEFILLALTNYFGAIKQVFPDEWDPRSYLPQPGVEGGRETPVLRRTVGYEALMRALRAIWPDIRQTRDLSMAAFLPHAKRFREHSDKVPRTTKNFGSSSKDAGALANLLLTGNIDEAQ